ncbi:MAG: hypothetical protein KBS63_06535 [Clostridiales bacterium]|nr:hypothetical protein [Candidatus Crickella caballi]
MSGKLKWYEIAVLYIGIIMGAGFASGRECWQFFGVFGSKGYLGTAAVTIGFIIMGCMLCTIARKKNTIDLGKLISPTDNRYVINIIGIIMAAILYSMIIAMTAAGGSLLNQQFGINKAIGGFIIAVLVVATVLGDFERLSKVFKLLVPVLFVMGLLTIFLVLKADFPQSGATSGFKPGRMSPNWPVSAAVFLSYNCLGMITMAGSSAVKAKDRVNAYTGSIAGCICLGGLTVLLLKAMLTDMAFSCSLDLPMLGFSARISDVLNVVYAIVLYGAVYSTAASTYYGFSTKLPDNKYKKPVIIAGAFAGFLLGLTGFKNLVEFLYPAQGYIGLLFMLLIIINFFKEIRNEA